MNIADWVMKHSNRVLAAVLVAYFVGLAMGVWCGTSW